MPQMKSYCGVLTTLCKYCQRQSFTLGNISDRNDALRLYVIKRKQLLFSTTICILCNDVYWNRNKTVSRLTIVFKYDLRINKNINSIVETLLLLNEVTFPCTKIRMSIDTMQIIVTSNRQKKVQILIDYWYKITLWNYFVYDLTQFYIEIIQSFRC